MEAIAPNDIRRLLKSLGVQSDQATAIHLERKFTLQALWQRLAPENTADCGDSLPPKSLILRLKGKSGGPEIDNHSKNRSTHPNVS